MFVTNKIYIFLCFIFQPYYYDVKLTFNILKNDNNTTKQSERQKTNRLFRHFYILLISYSFRILTVGLILLKGKNGRFINSYDLTATAVLSYTGLRKPVLFFVTAPIPLFVVAFHYVLYYRLNESIWTNLYYVIILNTKQYTGRYFPSSRVWQDSGTSTVKVVLKKLYTVNWRYFFHRKRLPNNDVLALVNIYIYYQMVYYSVCFSK